MINHAEKIDCRAFVSEKYFRYFSKKTFSAESLSMQDLLVKKQQGIEGLVLSRSADMRFRRQTGQKHSNLRLAHLSRVTFVVEEDEAFDPVDIGFLSPWAVMPGADCLAHLVKEPGLGCT